MKKLILVLILIVLVTFLLVGCTPGVTPVDPPIAGIDCPVSVVVSDEVLIAGKNYIQGGVEKTITVTFAVPTAPVSVYIGHEIADYFVDSTGLKTPELVPVLPQYNDEVVMYTTDNKVYTGTYTFRSYEIGAGSYIFKDRQLPNGFYLFEDCNSDYIYVETCGTCAACKYPYTVDSLPPTAKIQICAAPCAEACGGCDISFTSTVGSDCTGLDPYCDDDCSGLASWNIDIYDQKLGDCCTIACGGEIIDFGSGTTCPVDWSTGCLSTNADLDHVYAYVTLTDQVGNSTMFGYSIHQDWTGTTCDTVTVTNILPSVYPLDCLDINPHVDCPVCVDPIAYPPGNI
jgi:hypothetical protein